MSWLLDICGYHLLVLRLNTALDTKHLLEGVLVSMLDFECLPFLPEGRIGTGIAELRRVSIDRTGPVDFSESPLHFCKLEAHFLRFLVGQGCNGPFVDGSRGR